jgi:uncharacterized membrane protein
MFRELLLGVWFYLIFSVAGLSGYWTVRGVFGERLLSWWIAKPVGWLAFGYIVWVLASLRLLPVNQPLLLAGLFVVSSGAGWLAARPKRLPWRDVLRLETIVLGVYCAYLLMRSFNPNLNSGEKFMDVAMLQSAWKTDFFPFLDPWFASRPVNYYYYGYHLISLLGKISGAPFQLAYNYSLAVLYVTSTVTAAALLAQILPSWRLAVAGAFLTTTGGTVLYGLRSLAAFFSGAPAPYHATVARVDENSFIINELPSYGFTVCDLHPHVIGVAFFVLNLILLWKIAKDGPSFPSLALFTFCWASDALVNSWDAITTGLLFGAVLLRAVSWKRAAALAAASGAAAVVLCAPFLLNFQSPVAGLGFAPLYAYTNNLFSQAHYPTPVLWWLGLWGPFAALLLWGLWRQRRNTSRISSYVWTLWIVGFGLLLFVELFFLKDLYHVANPRFFRSNTVYKFGFHAWILLCLAFAASAKPLLGVRTGRWVIYATVGLGAFYLWNTLFQFYDITGSKSAGRKLTVDGTSFLNVAPEEAAVIRWINDSRLPREVLLETAGDGYGYHGRISAMTGLRNPINWQSHQWGWRFDWQNAKPGEGGRPPELGQGPILAIAADVAKMYQSADVEETRNLLGKYDVSYVIVGDMERGVYKSVQESKFSSLGRVVFAAGNTRLYKVHR